MAKNRWRIAGWSGALLLLLVPLIAMQFTGHMNWGPGDFLFLAAILGGVGVAFEFVVKKSASKVYRAAAALALLNASLMLWVNAAVGIIGSENNDANLMFGGVLLLGVAGGLLSHFESRGTARTLFAMAAAQVLVALIALIFGLGVEGASWPMDVVILSAFFAAMWILAGWLFRKAALGGTKP